MDFYGRFKSDSVPFRLLVMVAFVLVACGGGANSLEQSGTSAVTFQVEWDRSADFQRTSLSDCADVDTVSAVVSSTEGDLLGDGGPWPCATGSGVIAGLAPNYYATIAVAGYGPDGELLYYGQNQAPIFLDPGTVDAGVIVAGPFVPELVSPADTSLVATNALTLQWQRVPGAGGYQVTLAEDNSFAAESVIEQIMITDGSITSATPDVTNLREDVNYYWRVQAVSGADQLGTPSAAWQFSLGTVVITNLTSPELVSPADTALVATNALELQWQRLAGASGYQVTLATDDSFAGESVIEQIVITDGSITSATPNMTNLQEGYPYYWRVQAFFDADQLGPPSAAWQFSLRTVVITSVTFIDYGYDSVVAAPITTTVSFHYPTIDFTERRSETLIGRWSSDLMEFSDYFELQQIILSSEMIWQEDIVPNDGMAPCDTGWGGMSITMVEGDVTHGFFIYGAVCDPEDWPPGVASLVALRDTLVAKYEN